MIRLAWILAALSVGAKEAFAHASDRGHVLLLPTGHYLAGGAAAVAASFLVLFLAPQGVLERLARAGLPLARTTGSLRPAVSIASFLLLVLLILAGFTGSRDPLSNPLPLVVWTLLWVGLTLIQGSVGDVWAWVNPWHGPCVLVERLGWRAPLRLPRAVGQWPALFLLAAFAWFELVSVAPEDPARLAWAAGAYTVFTLMMMLLFGEEQWSRSGEFLTVFFRMVGRVAILQARPALPAGSVVELCWPAARLAAARPLRAGGMAFLLFALASVSFDGLSRTFAWLGLVGINPLEFPGRSALLARNSVGLALAFAALSTVFLAAVLTGERLTAAPARLRRAAGLYVWSLAPIALVYHAAHYLTVLLVNGQYALRALSDPFSLGWNLFGTAHMPVLAGFASGSDAAWLIWNLQAGLIVVGHVIAVLVAHTLAGRLHAGRRDAMLSQLPLAAVMVGYTVFGLWLLSTPAVG